MKNLTTETFKEKIFDYTQNKEWLFNGKKPTIIDFYADWCNPCKSVAPILEELSIEFDSIDFYKVDTETESELAITLGIQSIPSTLFIPFNGQPQMVIGALPKETFKKAINKIFFDETPENASEKESKE